MAEVDVGTVEEALWVSLLDASVLNPESWTADVEHPVVESAPFFFSLLEMLPSFFRTRMPGVQSPGRMDMGMLE